MGFRSFLAQKVYPAMNVGIQVLVAIHNSVEHCFWLLGGGSVIKIDKWLVVYLLCKYWEIGSDMLYFQGSHYFQYKSVY